MERHKNVLVTGHQAVLRCLLTYFLDPLAGACRLIRFYVLWCVECCDLCRTRPSTRFVPCKPFQLRFIVCRAFMLREDSLKLCVILAIASFGGKPPSSVLPLWYIPSLQKSIQHYKSRSLPAPAELLTPC